MRTTRHRGRMGDLPEMALCHDEDTRRAVLREVDRAMMPRTLRGWVEFILFALVIFYGPYLVVDFIVGFMLPPGRGATYLTFGLALVVYTLIVLLVVRRDTPRLVRKALLRSGIAVCRKCGYGLHGLPVRTIRCPECGHLLGRQVQTLLEQSTGTDHKQADCS